jgi:nitrite reductase/ring-hydroxylating ferredoxin subunit
MEQEKMAEPYAAYHRHLEPKIDEELTRVGPGTPGGEYLRRFWHPVALSDEIKDVPKRIRILGEDLVLFRDRSNRVGLLLPNCPHRNASLEFGIPAERGIRCCYHGWLIDIDGRLLETPSEAPESRLKERFCHGAYPVQEYKGLIFAYLGPPDHKPAFPIYDTYDMAGTRLIPGGWTPGRKGYWPANWVQLKENSMDVLHTYYLHTIATGPQFTQQFAIVPETEYVETPIGMVYIASRRVGENVWVRLHDLIMPNIHAVSSITEDGIKERKFGAPFLFQWAVPVDDTHLMAIGWVLETDEVHWDEAMVKLLHFGTLDDRPLEARQRQPGDYDAVVSQGPVSDHGREHLGDGDRGVVMFRRMLRQGIRAVESGKDPKGLARGNGEIIRTYTQNAVVKTPLGSTPDAEREILRAMGRRTLAGEFRPSALSERNGK